MINSIRTIMLDTLMTDSVFCILQETSNIVSVSIMQPTISVIAENPKCCHAVQTGFSSTSPPTDVLSRNGPDVIDRDLREGKKIFHVTVFEIEREEVAAGVLVDITVPQNQKQRTITQAQKVIEKNLSVVQKIAFLLGENAAETESMLNSIIDSYSDGEEEDQ